MLAVKASSVRSADGTELTAFETGGGNGPTFVLCNGLGGNIDAWRYLIDEFGPHHRIVSWDYRGLYKSGPAAETSIDLAAASKAMSRQVPFRAWDCALRTGHVPLQGLGLCPK